jgi:hypothetical protein
MARKYRSTSTKVPLFFGVVQFRQVVRAHFLQYAKRMELHPDGLRCIAERDWDLLGC